MKQLYFLHIPKTAGKFVSACIKKSFENDLNSVYISTHFPNNNEYLKNKKYISAHAGTYIFEKINNVDVATIVRHPVFARASYFNFIYPFYLKNREEYININNVKDKFKYYLFEDKNFLSHNNYQSRFLCNPSDARSWDMKNFFEKDGRMLMDKYKDGLAFDWFVSNDRTSLDLAIKNINSFKIKNTMDNVESFMHNINKWFSENYGVTINFDTNERINNSETKFNENILTSEDLVSGLTAEEFKDVISLNEIDYKVYNFVKNHEELNDKN